MNITRYTCPVNDCGWFFDANPSDLVEWSFSGEIPEDLTLAEKFGVIAGRTSTVENAKIEIVLNQHLEDHSHVDFLQTIADLKNEIATLRTSQTCHEGRLLISVSHKEADEIASYFQDGDIEYWETPLYAISDTVKSHYKYCGYDWEEK